MNIIQTTDVVMVATYGSPVITGGRITLRATGQTFELTEEQARDVQRAISLAEAEQKASQTWNNALMKALKPFIPV